MGNDKRMSPKKEDDKREEFLKSRDVEVPVKGDDLIIGELTRREVFATGERGRLKKKKKSKPIPMAELKRGAAKKLPSAPFKSNVGLQKLQRKKRG